MSDDVPSRKDIEAYQIGEDLYGLSLHELETRILAYETEIVRLRAELGKKGQEKLAADQLFSKN